MARWGMAFYPNTVTVHRGDMIVFANEHIEPHTVTFGPEPPSAPDSLFAPYGDPTHFDGTTPLNSGFLYPSLPFGMSFSVTFTATGTSDRICGLYDEMRMEGSITVVA